MAKFIVTAEGSDVGAAGNDEGMFLIVQVTDEAAEPVTGLTKANFKVWELGDLLVAAAQKIFFFSEIKVDVPSVDLPGFTLLSWM